MNQRRAGVIVVGVLIAGATLWWWRAHRERDTPATQAVTQPTDSASQPRDPSGRPAASVPATLTITVRDAGGPLGGATVRIAPEEGEVILAKTAGDGVATTRVEPGTYAISASASEHQPAALPGKQLVAGEDAKLTLTLETGGVSLSGVVTDVSGGPIAGTRIDAAKLGGMARPDAAIATSVTGSDGRYRMTVSEGQLLVAARSPDYSPQARYVDIGPAGGTADFALVPGGVIEGLVVDDRSKEPVPGAIVLARRDSAAVVMAEPGGHRVVAGPDGRFRIGGLPPGAYELGAHHENRRSKSPTMVGLGVAEQVTEVRILVGVGAVIRGTVVDDQGTPVAGAKVSALAEGGEAEAPSDARGAFVIEGLTAGQYTLVAASDAFVPADGTPVELADKDLDHVIVRMRPGTRLKGHVEPRQVAEVRLDVADNDLAMPMMISPITTGPDGAFELGPVAPGKGALAARCPSGDQGSMELEMTPGMAEIVLRVAAGASIAGRVLDRDGKPVAGAGVMASAQGPTQRTMIVNGRVTSGVQGVTNARGVYELKGLAAGSYRMSVLDRGRPLRMGGTPVQVTLGATDKKTGVDLAVDRPDGVIKGVVTGPDGKPLADAWVSVHQDLGGMLEGAIGLPHGGPGGPGGTGPGGPGGESRIVLNVDSSEDGGASATAGWNPPALTDAQGKFEITGLPHTSYEVVAEAQAGKLRGRAAAVTPNATLTIQALGVTSLSGTVRGPNGPPALFTIELDGPTHAERSFTDGTFSLGRVDPGNYVVKVSSSDGNGEAKLTVQSNTPATVDITLVPNAVVVGTIVDSAGKPVAGIPLTVIDDHGDGRMEISLEGPPPTTGADGKFRIEHKAGLGILVVMTSPRPVTKRGLALEAGKTLDVGAVTVASGKPG